MLQYGIFIIVKQFWNKHQKNILSNDKIQILGRQCNKLMGPQTDVIWWFKVTGVIVGHKHSENPLYDSWHMSTKSFLPSSFEPSIHWAYRTFFHYCHYYLHSPTNATGGTIADRENSIMLERGWEKSLKIISVAIMVLSLSKKFVSSMWQQTTSAICFLPFLWDLNLKSKTWIWENCDCITKNTLSNNPDSSSTFYHTTFICFLSTTGFLTMPKYLQNVLLVSSGLGLW